MEKNMKKNVCICATELLHFAIQQKLTQHWKSTILQLKKNTLLPHQKKDKNKMNAREYDDFCMQGWT